MFKRGDRKATTAIQLSWITVFLVGIFIVVFFLGFSSKQKEINQKIITTKLSYNLNSIFNSIKVSNNLYDKISFLEEVELNFDCETGTFSIDDQSFPYPRDSIFFTHNIKSKDLILMSKDWNKPFFVTNFIYLGSSQQRYILVYQNQIFNFVDNFYNELPEQLNKELVLFNRLRFIEDKNFDDIIIAIFSQYTANPGILQELNKLPDSFSNKRIHVVEFILNKNKVKFYEKSNTIWQVTPKMDFYDTETMIGALFSESSSEYFCTVSKALQNLKNTAQDLKTKINKLEQARPDCSYSAIDAKLDTLLTTTDSYSLNTIVDDINGYNKNLEMMSCPLLY